MSKLQEYIERYREYKELGLYCDLIKADATQEAFALRLQSDREDAKVWQSKTEYAAVAMVPTVVPTDEILELRDAVKAEKERAKRQNCDRITELQTQIDFLSNTAKGRELQAQLQTLEEQHVELKPQLRVKFA